MPTAIFPASSLVIRMKKSWLIAGLVVVAGLLAAGLALLYLLPLDLSDRSPQQPLAFSHRLHAGDQGIHCLFCHRYAPRSPVAGIPSVADCLACHQFIAGNAPEIKKLLAFWDRRAPIPWVRVYSLPDHVYFPHMMHLRARLACRTCHGEVATMERITRTASLKMGWCLGCHRQHKASIDCWTCHI
jgi:cytochrome c7-like protein